MGGWQEHFVQPPPLLCPCRDPCFPVPTAGKPCPALSWCLVHSRDWNSLHWFLTIHSKTESQAGAQMLLPLSNLISFLSDFSMAICSLALLFFLTIKFCLDIRLFLLPSQMILFYLFMYFWQVWRQGLSYTVIFKWDHSALAGSVLPTPGVCVWWDSRMTCAERMYRGGDLGPAYSFTKWSEKISDVPHLCLAFVSEISLESWREKSITFHNNTT